MYVFVQNHYCIAAKQQKCFLVSQSSILFGLFILEGRFPNELIAQVHCRKEKLQQNYTIVFNFKHNYSAIITKKSLSAT